MDETQVAGAIQGIGHIARTLPESTAQCLNALMACIKSPHGRPPNFIHICYDNILNTSIDCVVANAVVELKSLVQTQMQGATHAGPSSTPLTIVERLAYRIDEIRHAQARACIVWLVGQYAADDSPNAVVEGVVPWAPDVLRKIAKSFRDEARGEFCSSDQSSSLTLSNFFSSLPFSGVGLFLFKKNIIFGFRPCQSNSKLSR